jgi:hypothetical protein
VRWLQQALDGIWTDLLRRTLMSRSIVTNSRHAQTTGGGLSPPVGIALRAAAVVTYLILTSTVLTQLAARSAMFEPSAQVTPGSGVLPSAKAAAVEAPSDTTVPALRMPSRAPKVVTITVDGPNASVDVYCDTTAERAPFNHVHVGPEAIMDAYHRWCSPVRSE